MAGKHKKKNKKQSERWKKYTVKGDSIERNAKFCPRCGPGIFLSESQSKDRLYCGKCHYTEYKR